MHDLIQQEKARQSSCLELIASENFTSKAVMECLGSCLTNKYAEGTVGNRYYGGTQVVDKVEDLCKERALAAFRLKPEEWAVNVQPYSGSPANFAVYTALLKPHDRIMGLDLPSGGHLTHGYYSYSPKTGEKKKISATSVFFESLPYQVDSETGLIDYDGLAKTANLYKPQMIVCGGSAYSQEWDYKRFREIADSVGALLMMDMAHISGLVATEEADSPFAFADVVTTTTHKSLRGPRAGMIFCKRDERGFAEKIDFSVFPMLQGGPHMHQIGGLATQLKIVGSPEFKKYSQDVKANASTLAAKLVEKGFAVASGSTINHLVLLDLRMKGVTGSKMEKICDACNVTLNKNCVPGDRSALAPGGVRIGAPAMTTRGMGEADFEWIADILSRIVDTAIAIQTKTGKKLVDFIAALDTDEGVKAIREEVIAKCSPLFMPGV
jgi:glycine hydroxymethyltransferase